jgi:hypothetical protein
MGSAIHHPQASVAKTETLTCIRDFDARDTARRPQQSGVSASKRINHFGR